MTTQRERDEQVIRDGKQHVTMMELTVTKDGDDYTVGNVMAERHGHELGDEYLWHSDSGALWENVAKCRQCSIKARYRNTTYILDNDDINLIDDIDIEEIKND
ncbi:hypothetical protein pVa21_091 [Vibrio phage pVa-21]|nr:hypothetical protein pVa21_091 [Vibrio phage pVa-21]